MRILLSGASGRVGWAVRAHAQRIGSIDVIALDRARDLSEQVRSAGADVLVHAAAMTDVDGCERDPGAAHQANAGLPARLAALANAEGMRFCLVSTDYVFDGQRGGYTEKSAPSPINEYGRSKLAGERAAQAVGPCLVVRTSMLFGAPHRPDFVTLARTAHARGHVLRVVDQRGTPTHVLDLARQVLGLVESRATGVFHACGATPASRAEVARMAAPGIRLQTVAPDSLGWKARRPLDSSLSTAKPRGPIDPWTLDEALSVAMVRA